MKYLLIILSTLSLFCSNKKVLKPASTWAATASNELVSFNAFRDGFVTGVFGANNAGDMPTGSNEMITKSDLLQWAFNVDPDASSISAMSNTRLPTKQQIIDALYNNSTSIRLRSTGVWTTACDAANGSQNVPNPATLTLIYHNGGLTTNTTFRAIINLSSFDPAFKENNVTSGYTWTNQSSAPFHHRITDACIN